MVAEGVESREASGMLAAFSCDQAQGYYYSRPLPAGKITAHMKKLTQHHDVDLNLRDSLVIKPTAPTGLINRVNGLKSNAGA